jgi:hypothetical protein
MSVTSWIGNLCVCIIVIWLCIIVKATYWKTFITFMLIKFIYIAYQNIEVVMLWCMSIYLYTICVTNVRLLCVPKNPIKLTFHKLDQYMFHFLCKVNYLFGSAIFILNLHTLLSDLSITITSTTALLYYHWSTLLLLLLFYY